MRFFKLLLPVFLAGLLLLSGCDDSGAGDGSTVNPADPFGSVSITNSASLENTAIPENFSLSVSYTIEDTMWNNLHDYQVVAYFQGKNNTIIEMKVEAVAAQSGTVGISFSIDESFFSVVDTPYVLYCELQDSTDSTIIVLDDSDFVTFTYGTFTADYSGYLHYYSADSYTEILLDLTQYGNKVFGTMTGADNPGDVVVDINASVSGDDLNMDLEGLGELEGDAGSTYYEGTADSYGDGLYLNCENYYLQGSSTARGSFSVDRIGSATVSGTVNIPAADAFAIHNVLDGKDCAAYLMFDFAAGEHGGIGFTEMVWDGSESMSYTAENIPAGVYSVVFLSDCNEDGDNAPADGECFGVAGMSANDAGDLLIEWYGGSPLPAYPTITVTEGSSLTADDIELWFVDLP